MTWLLLLLGLWIWWMSGYKQRKRLRQIAKELPTSIPAFPIVGQAYIFLGNDEDKMKALQRLGRDAIQQGGTIAYWQGHELLIGVADPVVADLLLRSCLSKHEYLMNAVRIFTGNGSLAAPVHTWRPRRKILSPIFSPKNLHAFVEIFARQSATTVKLLRPMAGAGDFSIWKYVATYTFDSVTETNLGVKMNSQKNKDHPFLEAFDQSATFMATRMVSPWLHPDLIYRMLPSYRQCKSYVSYVDNFVSATISNKRNAFNGLCRKKESYITEPKKLRTLIELLMEAPGEEKKLNDTELLEETKVIISAGTDTSAIGACNTFLMLARHAKVQEAVYKELQEVFGDSDREATVEDLSRLKYLELVIKESLRLYPPVPAIVREVIDDITLPNGTTLTKGCGIVAYIFAIHRNPHYWGADADKFRPERFLEPLKHPAQFMPFSWGMRNCLGYQYAMLSLKTVTSTILRRYQVLPPSDLDPAHYEDPLRVRFKIMMMDVDNFIVRLKERVSLGGQCGGRSALASNRMQAIHRLGNDAIQQGGTIAYWMGQELAIGVADPVVADLLLRNCLSKDEKMIRLIRIFTGNGSISAPVPVWRPRRKLLSPIFSLKNLHAFVEVFAKQSATTVRLLRPMTGKGDFSIWKYLATYTFDSVTETNLGVELNSQMANDHPFLGAFDECGTLMGERLCSPWLHNNFIYRLLPSYRQCVKCVDVIDDFLRETIAEKRKVISRLCGKKESDVTKPKTKSLVELLINAPEDEKKLNDTELLEETKVIIGAATDTSAIGACYTFLMLARHPKVQDAVYKELQEVFGDSDREAAVEDLSRLKYLELVIKESLRMYPPVPAILREVNDDITLPNGTTLTKGVGIVVYITAVNRNPHYWGADADKFRPERFLEPLKHPAQFMAFSWGMRNCIGYQYAMLSLKTVTSTILRRYQVLPPSDLDPAHYEDPLRVKFNIMMKDADNFMIRLEERQKMRKFVELAENLPGELPTLPVVGHAHLLAGNDEANMNTLQIAGRIAVKRGGLSTFWMAHKPYLVVADPVVAELMLKTHLEKDSTMKILQFLVGNGSIYAPVSIWRPRRKILAPTFNIKKLNRFVDVFASQSALTATKLRPAAGKGTFPVWKYMTSYTFHSVCETTLGVHMNADEDVGFIESFEEVVEHMTWRILQPWLYPNWVYRLLPQYKQADKCRQDMYTFVDKIIKLKRQEMEDKQREVGFEPKPDSYLGFQSLLEMLLETSLKVQGFTDLELREEALVMSAAGTDTSAVAASFALVMLARNPEVQENVYEELNEVLDHPDKAITAADLPKLKYLEAVVKETLRLYPPVPMIVRKVTTDTKLPSGVTVPAGTGICMHIWATHRNHRYWGPDVDCFRPERFLEPLKHPSQFVPFSFGVRNCLGYQYAMMSLKTVLATLLKEYRVLPPAEADLKSLDEPIRVKYDIMMKAVDMFQIQLEVRTPVNSRNIG
ncbi:uncharacterized protein LOC125226417 [Leguminivora glycinivorella]|uniref:uncharacterized protein LOC125226417 n=1 Tax=Leguminivora glycinivorella TaxID=1035111 RepID=UPI00200E4DF3|nr:uncharacterized protein LOC125226417 [Leguminivora glycinivorella]